MKVLETSLNYSVLQCMPTPWAYVLNSLCYSKNSLAPIPFSNVYSAIQGTSFMTFKRGMHHNINAPRWKDCSIINDVYSNKFYQFWPQVNNKYVSTYDNSSNVLSVENKTGTPVTDIFHETDQYIYTFGHLGSTAVANISRTDKATDAVSRIDINYGGPLCFIKKDSQFAYFAGMATTHTFAYQVFQVIKLNLIDWNYSILYSDNTYYGAYYQHFKCEPVCVDNTIYVYNARNLRIDRYSFAESLVTRLANLPLTKAPEMTFITDASVTSGGYSYLVPERDKDNNIYLTLCPCYEGYFGASSQFFTSKVRLYTYKVNVSNFELVWESDYINLRSMIEYQGHIVTLADDAVSFYRWNPIECKYTIGARIEKQIYEFGFDLDDIAWYRDKDSKIYYTAINQPVDMTYHFEKNIYYYSGDPIDTFITSNVTNFLGANITVKSKIKLIGNAIFTETSDKNITINFSKDESSVIPVTITGPGMIKMKVEISS